MAHLASSYTSFETFLNGADSFWKADLTALNSSGVEATAIFAMQTDEDGSAYLNVAVSATGMTPDQVHAQHVHGLFDEDGNPVDSVSPTLADDADRDGQVEVLEGVGQYGDVLLPLVSPEGGGMPSANADGTLSFIQSYDLGDGSNFGSPVTMTDYTAEDIMPLALREIVLHGQNVPDGIGEGTDGEVDGGTNGYTGILPVSSGEIEESSLDEALAILGQQQVRATDRLTLTNGDDMVDTGPGDDFVNAAGGDDSVAGGGDNDTLFGGAGSDTLDGGIGDDMIHGDGVFTADPTMVTGQVYRLYQASFDRDPDLGGFEGWAGALGRGAANLSGVAAGFEGSAEFDNTYGGTSDEAYVRALYDNVLGRDADATGLDYWTSRLDAGASRAQVLTGFSESAEFRVSSADDVTAWVEAQGAHDVIAGDGGANTLSGGVLSDTFVFGTDDGTSDTVTDLEGWDMLDFQAFGYGAESEAIAQMSQSGDDVLFADAGVEVGLQDTQLSDVSADMILV